jgi:cell division protein FtsB
MSGPIRLWLCAFALWGLFLSGVGASFVGSPGVIQAVRLKRLLDSKLTQSSALQAELTQLRTEAIQLERSKVTQQREIRRVLGYTAPDEIIFDFTDTSITSTL